MNEQVTNKQREISEYLAGEDYETFIDLLLKHFGKIIQKLARQEQLVSFYWSAAFICVMLLGIGFGAAALFGELRNTSLEVIKIELLGMGLAYLSLIIFKNARNSVIEKIQNQVIFELESESDLEDLKTWLKLFANWKLHLIFCLLYATFFWLSLRSEFMGIGAAFIVFSIAFIWGIPMYFLITLLLLPLKLGKYEFRLYGPDPSSSKIVLDLARLFQGLVYLYAIVASGSMIFIAYSGILPTLMIPSLLVAWLPIIALFLINQYALSNIIIKGKRDALIEIQGEIENIQQSKDLAEKENMDKVIRLMDYHDRVKATRNSTLDLRAGFDFLNSLLLPVIGFFIGKIDIKTVIEIFENTKRWLTPR